MQDRNCSVPGCDRERTYRAWCRSHYRRWYQTGDVQASKPLRDLPTRDQTIEQRILSKCVASPDGCIEWTGDKNRHGYGRISWHGQPWLTHRAIWTVQVGPIPTDDDWTIDHLCRNRACCNIKHLEVVTRWENSRRGGGLEVAQAKNRTRSHCPNGHRYTPDTTYTSSHGHRMCKPCKNAMWRKSSARTNSARRQQYQERRAAGATPYQALFADWWNRPAERPRG